MVNQLRNETMTRFFKIFPAILVVAFAASPAFAQDPAVPAVGDLFDSIHVVVGPSRQALQSIAVTSVGCAAGAEPCGKAGKTVSRDLELSGYFKVLDPNSFLADQKTETLTATSWADWTNVGASWLIKYSVSGSGKNLDVQFRLYDVNQKAGRPVAAQSFPGIGPSQIRPSAHKFVNAVIEVITGHPGIFGSVIAVSLKSDASSRDIYLMEMDGSGRRKLVSNGSSNMFPRFTRGGALLYTSFKSGMPQLYLGERRVTHDSYEYRGAEMSPDGRSIAASVDLGEQSDLVLIDPQTGKIIRKLTDTPWDEVSPTWSNGGNLIAYVSSEGGHPQIYIMNADGTGQRRLTMAGSYNTSPRFGPGNRVVFSGMDMFRSDLFVVDLEGNISRLTQEQGNNKDGSWSPDGRYLVFLSDRTGDWRVWIMTEDGRYQFPISSDQGRFGTPDWR
jgi:TolB protein